MNEFLSLSLGGVLERVAEAVPDERALVCEEDRKTYKELNTLADALPGGYRRWDYGRETGTPTPYYTTMTNLVKAFEDRY